jgi:hypothetical protein
MCLSPGVDEDLPRVCLTATPVIDAPAIAPIESNVAVHPIGQQNHWLTSNEHPASLEAFDLLEIPMGGENDEGGVRCAADRSCNDEVLLLLCYVHGCRHLLVPCIYNPLGLKQCTTSPESLLTRRKNDSSKRCRIDD